MKLITTELGQTLQLFRSDEIRPERGIHLPSAARMLVQRYQFAKFPSGMPGPDGPQAYKFEDGVIHLPGGMIPILNLDIYNDGVIVNVRNTADADAVMDDFFLWASDTFGLRKPQTQIPRQHASNVIVDFDHSINRLAKNFEDITRFIEGMYEEERSDLKCKLHINRFGFAADPKQVPAFTQTVFVIEPRANVPYVEHRYFSSAPVTTERHLAILEYIEKVLTS